MTCRLYLIIIFFFWIQVYTDRFRVKNLSTNAEEEGTRSVQWMWFFCLSSARKSANNPSYKSVHHTLHSRLDFGHVIHFRVFSTSPKAAFLSYSWLVLVPPHFPILLIFCLNTFFWFLQQLKHQNPGHSNQLFYHHNITVSQINHNVNVEHTRNPINTNSFVNCDQFIRPHIYELKIIILLSFCFCLRFFSLNKKKTTVHYSSDA